MTPKKLLEYAIFLDGIAGVCLAGAWAAHRTLNGS